jgi:hypothetical protein
LHNKEKKVDVNEGRILPQICFRPSENPSFFNLKQAMLSRGRMAVNMGKRKKPRVI